MRLSFTGDENEMNVQTMRESRSKNAADMKAILATAEAEARDLTAEEAEKFDALKATNETLKASIERAEFAAAEQADLDRPRPTIAQAAAGLRGAEAKKEFESFGEFMSAVRFNPDDQRLRYARREIGAENTMGTGTEGGFAIPEQFRSELLRVEVQGATIRPRAMVLPAGSPPDATITMPALDQTAATGNMYGGVAVNWIAEGGAKPETDVALKEVSLTPQEVAGHIVVTDKLLRNWQAAGSVLETQLRAAIVGAEETAFFSGSGTGRPTGLLAAANTAAIAVERGTALTITYADLTAMYAKLLGGNGVWIASRAALPQLMSVEDTNGNLVWQPDARAGIPNTIFGLPVIVDDRLAVALGAKGDIGLYDLSKYLIKDGSGPFVEASQHVHFTSNKTVIKAFWNVDAKPWLTAPLTLEGGQTASPFVVLDVPGA